MKPTIPFILEASGENIHSCVIDESILPDEKNTYSFSVSRYVDSWEVVNPDPLVLVSNVIEDTYQGERQQKSSKSQNEKLHLAQLLKRLLF